MGFVRVMAVAVLLLACVVLGSACTGAKGDTGPKGDPGADGVGVENIVNNGDGTFTVNLTNGEAYTTDNLTGPRGEKGEKGDRGPQGVQGIQGVPGSPGPNWIAAMPVIGSAGGVHHSYNVNGCTYMSGYYVIDMAFDGSNAEYPVLLATESSSISHGESITYTWNTSGNLVVALYDSAGNPIADVFSFCVLHMP
ncbi:MAG: hypothetical protein QUS33_13530 [Dehalococcoidia bacterium]|nr:hypothetical protein [Dehalococcoidia bacterium]